MRSFIKPKIFVDAHIQVCKAWPKNNVASGIPMPAGRNVGGEGCRIEPLLRSFGPLLRILTCHQIGTQRIGVAIVAKTGIVNSKGSVPISRLPAEDASPLPASQKCIRERVHPGAELSAPAEGEL